MKTMRMFGLLLAAVAVASPLAGQRPGPGRPGMGMGMGPGRGEGPGLERVIALALERRDSLGLSVDQVRNLEALGTEIEQRNEGLRERMEGARAEADGDRRAMREQMLSLMESTREEREAQRGRFEQLLTEEQRARLGPLLRGDRAGRGRGPEGGVRSGPRGPGGPGFGRGFGRDFGPPGPVARAYREGLRDGFRAGRRR